jgi:uncharacterized membrane protein YccC
MLAILVLVIFMLVVLMLVLPRLVKHMLVIFMLAIIMLVVPSLEKFNKFEVFFIYQCISKEVNVQTHKNLELDEIQRRAPLSMVQAKVGDLILAHS